MKKRIWKIRWQTTQKIILWCLSFVVTISFSLGFLPFNPLENNSPEDFQNKYAKLIEKVKADLLSGVSVNAMTLTTTTSRDTYSIKLNATSGNFTANHKYFVYWHMGISSSNAPGWVSYQVKYGSNIQFTGVVETAGTTAGTFAQVSWMDVYTQPATAVAITVGFRCGYLTDTAGAINASLVAIDLDEKMIENYDYYYNEDTTDTQHTTTWTSKASITLNNADGIKDWVIFAMEDLKIDDVGINAQARIYNGNAGHLARSQEGEDAIERFTFVLIRAYNDTARGTTYSIQVKDDETGANNHAESRIFALNMNVFAHHDSNWGGYTGVELSDSMTEILTLSYGAPTAEVAGGSNNFVFSSYLNDVAAADTQSNDRLTSNGTTPIPIGWDWNQNGYGRTSYDATDITSTNMYAVVYMTSEESYTINLDAQEIVGDAQHARGRSIVVFSQLYNYMPQFNNWRWYADEENTTPGTAYAAENTAPPQAEMGKSIGMKLRVNIDDVGGRAEDNNRKKLYYATTTTGPWTEVAEMESISMGTLFRYYNGGGDDDILVNDSTLLTGTTARGIHNESNSDDPNNSYHAADAVVEHEYCIENYDATANTTYYFGLFDQTVGLIPPASGKSFPSLTTASSYNLSLEAAPSAVYLGSWQIGDGTYHSYDFTSDEKIQLRDNRGVGQVTGGSSGWSLSADITTELVYTAAVAYCSSVTFTGSGLDDMSIFWCNNTLQVETDYKVEIIMTPGLGLPDVFMWYREGNIIGTGECGPAVFLEESIFVSFTQIDGHTVGDYWEFTAYPAETYTITKANMYWITNTITGLYDAPTDPITGNSGEYMSSAVTAASVPGNAKDGLGGFKFQPTLRIYNASMPGDYIGGVITFTLT